MQSLLSTIYQSIVSPPAELGPVASYIIAILVAVVAWQQRDKHVALTTEREKWREVLVERHKICDDERNRFDAHTEKTLSLLQDEIRKRDERWLESQKQMEEMTRALTLIADRLSAGKARPNPQ